MAKNDAKVVEGKTVTPINPNVLTFGDVRVENTLKFKPRPELNNLCIGKLVKVEILDSEVALYNEAGVESTWEYAGHTIPRLELTFEQNPTTVDPAKRVYKDTCNVIGSLKNDGTPIELKTVTSLYESMYARLKHICNAYKHKANYSEAVADVNKLAIDVSAPVEDRIVMFRSFLQYFVDLLAGKDGKGIYTGTDCWMKLVADYSSGKFLAFPTFVGEGFIEPVIAKRNPAIEIKPGESVELVAGKKGSKGKGGAADKASEDEAGVESDVADLINKYNKK